MNTANLKPKPAFDITFVDLRLPNKQKRQHLVFRALTQAAARVAFHAKHSDKVYKILSVDEVLAEPSVASLASLSTHFSKAA